MKNKETILLVAIALIVGLLVGVIFSKGQSRRVAPAEITSTQPAAQINMQQNIKMLEELVAKDPKKRSVWIELGNSYYDTQQPQKAIEAYGKALELDPKDPNVLTDQGVMYRQLGWFDKAIENFARANTLDPRHIQSLYNLGVVYRHDLKDFVKAREAWKQYLDISPSGPAAARIREELQAMEALPVIPAGQMPLPSGGINR